MTARTEMSAATADLARFDDAIVAMDIVDAIRRDPALAAGDAAAQAEGLRAYYRRVGIAVSDSAIATGLAAVNDNRFSHVPRTRGPRAALARLYIERRRWQPAATVLALVLVLGFGGYFLAYRPYRDALARQAQLELSETMPAQMQALYQTIHEETKVQQAETEAVTLRDRGQAAAKAGNRVAAEQAIIDLTNLRDTLRADHTACPTDIFNNDLLAENLAHALRKHSRRNIVRPASRERVDHGDRAAWPLVGRTRAVPVCQSESCNGSNRRGYDHTSSIITLPNRHQIFPRIFKLPERSESGCEWRPAAPPSLQA